MDWFTDWLIGFVQNQNNPLGLAVLAGSAAIEYIVPPFPGDTVTLFGAVLITAYGWSFFGVFGAVMIGSCAGAMLAYALGTRLRKRQLERGGASRLKRLIDRFERHGAIYLVLNRFFPGIRALFFVAAGMAGMRPLPVLAYSAISAALWNLGLIGLGALAGANFETLRTWVGHYTTAVWIILGAVVAVWIVRAVYSRRTRTARERDPGGS